MLLSLIRHIDKTICVESISNLSLDHFAIYDMRQRTAMSVSETVDKKDVGPSKDTNSAQKTQRALNDYS